MKVEQVLELVKAVSESELTEFKYEEDGVKLSLKENRRQDHPGCSACTGPDGPRRAVMSAAPAVMPAAPAPVPAAASAHTGK